MIADFVANYDRGAKLAKLASYTLGVSDSMAPGRGEMCSYLTDNRMHLHSCGEDIDNSTPSQIQQAEQAATRFEEMIGMNSRVRKPICHIVLSAPAEDGLKLTEQVWRNLTQDFMAEMGYGENLWMATLHRDTDHPHVHIVACTIQDLPGHPVVKRWNEYPRAVGIMRTLEEKYELRRVEPPKQGRKINNPQEQTRKDSLRQAVDNAIDQALLETPSPNLLTLYHLLQETGIEPRIQWQRGNPKGVSFKMDGFTCTGTKLGANERYTLHGLQELGIRIPVDRELLELEALTAPRRPDPSRPESQPHTDHDIALSMMKTDSDTLLASKKIAAPSRITHNKGHSTWIYRLRVYRPKLGAPRIAHVLKAVTKAVGRILLSVLRRLGKQEPKIKLHEPTAPTYPGPLRATIRPGKRFRPEPTTLKLCRVNNRSRFPDKATHGRQAETPDAEYNTAAPWQRGPRSSDSQGGHFSSGNKGAHGNTEFEY